MMPVLSITVTSEVIQHANDIIQKGGGTLPLALVAGRWELLLVSFCEDEIINGAILGTNGGSSAPPPDDDTNP